MEKIENKPYFASLTGVRAVAALLVYITHFNPFKEAANGQNWFFTFAQQGQFGVPIFFVLSGFLIATRYQKRIEPNLAWAKKYMQNRVARIYPLYFLLTALTFLIYQADASYDPIDLWQTYKPIDKLAVIILNFTFLRGFFSRFFFSGISQGWSLTVEETFYVLAPFMLLSIAGRLQRLLVWAVSLLGFGIVLALLCSPFGQFTRGFFGDIGFMMSWTFFGHILEFATGIALAILVAREGEHTRTGVTATYGGVFWIICCAVFIATMKYFQISMTAESLKILTINFLLPPGICLLFYGLLRENTSLRRLLETRTFDLLGKSSYVFYLIHVGVLSVALTKAGSNPWFSLPIIVLASILLFKCIEEPLHKQFKAKTAR